MGAVERILHVSGVPGIPAVQITRPSFCIAECMHKIGYTSDIPTFDIWQTFHSWDRFAFDKKVLHDTADPTVVFIIAIFGALQKRKNSWNSGVVVVEFIAD